MQHKRDAERDRSQRIPPLRIRSAAPRCRCARPRPLHRGRYGEDGERDGPDALAGALDALVHETVRVTVLVFVAVMRVMFVRPGV